MSKIIKVLKNDPIFNEISKFTPAEIIGYSSIALLSWLLLTLATVAFS